MFTWNRPGVELNGAWKFCPDPMERCRSQKWWKRRAGANDMFPCWDPDGLWEIQVPGTWKTQFPQLEWYDGHAVYYRPFEMPALTEDQEAFLVFDGVIYEAEVYLNGQYLGTHDRGYSPFSLRVTECLHAYNELFVLVDNHLKADRVPGMRYDWNNDGGIVNPVKLIVTPRTFVENFRLRTTLDAQTITVTIDLWLQSRDERAMETVTVRLPELGVEATVTAVRGEQATARIALPRSGVTLWSPETPKLYRLEIATRHETLTDEVGLREIRREGREILLNDQPLQLAGLCIHSDFPATGRTATADGIELMLAHARDLGANFLRCAHYPYTEEFGRAMDRAGMLWWEEVPAYWLTNIHESPLREKACGMLEEMIRRDWNRASIIVWSVSNECCYRNPENYAENNYPYWREAVALVRALDPSRLISCAEAGNRIAVEPTWDPTRADEFAGVSTERQHWRPGHTDDIYDLWDILSANLYVQTQEEVSPAYSQLVEMLRPYNKPIMISEFGSMSVSDATCPPEQLGHPARHAALLRESYRVFAELPEIKGVCLWNLADLRAPIHWRWYNGGQGVFRYGVLDEKWVKKPLVYEAAKECITGFRLNLDEKD